MAIVSIVLLSLLLLAHFSFASPTATLSGLLAAKASSTCAVPRAKYSSFSYTPVSSNRYATPVPSPLLLGTTYAPPFSKAAKLLAKNITTTTYSLNPAATATNDGEYGQSAYAALCASIKIATPLPFTTTVAPTPVASSELVYPPPLYSACPSADSCLDCYKLPPDFIWGVSSSAYQIEGGLQFAGRGPSVVDSLGIYFPAAEANVANMNYFLYKQDIARLAAIGVPHLAFSIPWTRVVPFGYANSPVNRQALNHYEDLIDTCIKYGITPIVTLVHYDRPINLPADSPDFQAGFFYYATQVMAHFGNRVPIWITFNEPNLNPGFYYSTNNGITNILLSHAQLYKWYKNTLGGTGRITMKFANNLATPLDQTSADDTAAAERYQDFLLGTFSNPLFLGKQYPTSVLNTPDYNLTALTPAQIKYIHGTADFFSFDPYTAQYAAPPPNGIAACQNNPSDPNYPVCVVTTNVQANGWYMGFPSNGYTYIAPQYVRQQIGFVWNTYKPTGVLVAEFGFDVYGEALRTLDQQRYDLDRTLYYQEFLREMLKSVYEDNVNVIGALAWTYMDDDEFVSTTDHYGMQTVNFTSGNFERHYKRSFFDYVDFFHQYVQ